MVEDWLIFSIMTFILWGFWAFISKIALTSLGWETYFTISSIATLIMLPIVSFHFKPQINIHSIVFWYALLAGGAGSIATIIFYLAMARGKASVIVPLAAMYPLVTVVLSLLILKERPSPTQGLGIAFALLSIFLISIK